MNENITEPKPVPNEMTRRQFLALLIFGISLSLVRPGGLETRIAEAIQPSELERFFETETPERIINKIHTYINNPETNSDFLYLLVSVPNETGTIQDQIYIGNQLLSPDNPSSAYYNVRADYDRFVFHASNNTAVQLPPPTLRLQAPPTHA